MARAGDWLKFAGAVVAAGVLFAIAKQSTVAAAAPAPTHPVQRYGAPGAASFAAPFRPPSAGIAPRLPTAGVTRVVGSHPPAVVTRHPTPRLPVHSGPVRHIGFGGTPITRRYLLPL